MTAQEIFEKVAKHLLTQGCRAEVMGSCKYLTGDGLKCAVGCLIPDGHEGQRSSKNSNGLLSYFPDLEPFILPQDMYRLTAFMFIRALQDVHDDVEVQYWKQGLRTVAERYNLTIPTWLED